MHRRVVHRFWAIAVAASVLTAACSSGSGGHGGAPGRQGFSIAAVAQSMVAARTARVRVTSSVSTGTGEFDFAHQIGEFETGPVPAVRSEVDRTILDGGVSYTQLDAATRMLLPPRLASGRHWMRFPKPSVST